MIHPYVICEPPTAASLPPRRGLGGARLRTAVSDGLAAVYSRHRAVQASPERVMAHQRVVEAVMANGTVLPLRFGTRLGSEPELVAALAARHDELVRAIERVRGHVEIGLRVIPRSSAESQPRSPGAEPVKAGRNRGAGRRRRPTGRAYLLERVTEHHLAERSKREIHLPLTRLAKAEVLASRVRPPAILAASYLVPADEAPRFQARAGELAAGIEDVQSFITGPWPPYSFVDLRERPSSPGAHQRR